MRNDCPVLEGRHVRLEPMQLTHLDGLVAAAAVDPTLYGWTIVPQGRAPMLGYMESAIAAREAGSAVPFVHVRVEDGRVVGSTRFFDLDRWAWPETHERFAGSIYDGCEIGWTWLAADAVRTALNTEAKLLLMTHAFERWNVLRLQLSTDARNERSAAAIERLGAKLDGRLRAQKLASDLTPRLSLRYSILNDEWPAVKAGLEHRLARS
ncbi:Protein N-acetyltransferase, RimJ/RimL family [Bryocella elongata]|uniref:Protein N-acetyltransferase, RimJ/RimL family n=1 Tax=Bryocella elongata TaxID=863522 RepID=A0A1H5WIJ5_9BACT|nr:GNAT family protein [Bryocella elongata]SEF98707.1 Protein N-acetyltransferase, RimJ/RimL family [Bryocella elongata]